MPVDIQQLPAELLIDIAQHVCVENCVCDDAISIPAIELSHVCQEWRHIALATASLWSTFSVSVRLEQYLDLKRKALTLLLTRSGNAPLFVSLHLHGHCDLVRLLAQHSTRWARLSLRVLDLDTLASLGCIYRRIPLLEHLEVTVLKDRSATKEHINIFSIAPRLRTVNLPPKSCNFLDLTWVQIEFLSSGPLDMDLLASYLSVCTGLHELSLQYFYHLTSQICVARPCSSLHSLTLQIECAGQFSSVEHLFSYITLPNLKSLCFLSRRAQSASLPYFQQTFVNFIKRSQCLIETLRLDNIPMHFTGVIALLENIPHLTHLLIHEPLSAPGIVVMDALLHRLSASDTDMLLPYLQYLDLTFHGVSWRAVMETIRSRLVAASTLTSVALASQRVNLFDLAWSSSSCKLFVSRSAWQSTCELCNQSNRHLCRESKQVVSHPITRNHFSFHLEASSASECWFVLIPNCFCQGER